MTCNVLCGLHVHVYGVSCVWCLLVAVLCVMFVVWCLVFGVRCLVNGIR